MRRFIFFTALIFAASTVRALSSDQLEIADQERIQRALDAAALDLSRGTEGSGGGCIGTASDGRMSLLDVKSEYKGPTTQGLSPVTKLGPEHPAMKRLIDLGTQMGFYRDPDNASPEVVARNAAARERKALHDTYAEFVGFSEGGVMKGGLPMAELFGWVYEGKMEQMAKAYAEYEELARQYAPLYEDAKAAGSACP